MNIKAIILDIDQTLVDTENCNKKYCIHKKFYIKNNTYYLHKRPYIDDLFSWCCTKNIDIIIFSAAYKSYVDYIVEFLFLEHKNKPISVLCADHLVRHNYIYTKSLRKVEEITGISSNNLISVDDMRDNYIINDDHKKTIYIEPWTWKDDSDVEILCLIGTLNNI